MNKNNLLLNFVALLFLFGMNIPTAFANDHDRSPEIVRSTHRGNIYSSKVSSNNVGNSHHLTRKLQPPRPKSKPQMKQKKKIQHDVTSSTSSTGGQTSGATGSYSGRSQSYSTDGLTATTTNNVNSSSDQQIRNATPISKNLSVYMYALAASIAGIAIASTVIRQKRVRNVVN